MPQPWEMNWAEPPAPAMAEGAKPWEMDWEAPRTEARQDGSQGFWKTVKHIGEVATGGPPPEQKGITAESFWPVRLGKQIVGAVKSAATAPRDVLSGELDPNSQEGIQRALDFATVASGLPGRGGVSAASPSPQRFIRAQMPGYVDDVAVARAGSLMSDAAKRGVTLTWPEALSQVTGRPVLNDMQRVLEGARQSKPIMQEAIGNRPAEIKAAAQSEISGIAPPSAQPSAIGPAAGAAAEADVGRVRQTINQVSEPFYDRASTFRLTADEMNRVRAIPGFEAAEKAVRSDPQLNRNVSHLPNDSIGFLNEVKKVLDQQADNAESPVQQGRSVQRAAGLRKDAAAVRDAAINAEAAGGEANFAQALNIQEEGRRRYLEPLLQGPLGQLADKNITTKKAIKALFPSDPLAGSEREVATTVGALSRQNPDAARQLVRAHVEAKLNEAFDAAGRSQEPAGFAGASMAHRLAGGPVGTQRGQNFRAAVEALPNGRDLWPGIERFLEIARATGTRQPIGSQTAFNEAMLHSMATGKPLANVLKTAASPGEWWHFAHELWGKWQTGNNLAELARIITDPNSAAAFRSLARSPRISRNAVKLAARITLPAALHRESRRMRSENMPFQGQ